MARHQAFVSGRKPLKRVLQALVGVAAMVAATVAVAPAASAHTPNWSLTCSTWAVSGSAYDTNQNNTYLVVLDGTQVAAGNFKGSFSVSGPVPATATSHTLTGHIWQNNNPNATYSRSFSLNVSKCPVTKTAQFATPTVSPATCTLPADAGKQVWESVTKPTDGNGLTYTMSGPNSSHKVTVTATLASGYQWPSTLPSGWTKSSDGKKATWTYTLKSRTCDKLLPTFATPTVSPAQCTERTAGKQVWESVTKPTDGNGLTYTMSGPDGNHKVTVTATLASGYQWPSTLPSGWTKSWDGKKATWSYTLKSTNCAKVVAPTVNPAACQTPDGSTQWQTVSLPTSGNGISYSREDDSSAHTVKVTATLAAGYVFPADLDSQWTVAGDGRSASRTIQLESVTCDTTARPVAPTVNDAVCEAPDGSTQWQTVSLPTSGNGLSYTKSEPDENHKVTVTATLATGYVFPTDLSSDWTVAEDGRSASQTIQLESVTCDTTVTPGEVTFSDQCGVNGDTYTIPNTTGVEYIVGEGVVEPGTYPASGTVTVTARAADGYVLAENEGGYRWSREFTNETCPTPTNPPTNPPTSVQPTTVTPSATPQCIVGDDGNHITVTTPTQSGVEYTVTGNGSASVTVTAKATSSGILLAVPTDWTSNGDGSVTTVISGSTAGIACVAGVASSVEAVDTPSVLPLDTTTVEVQGESEEIAYTGINVFGLSMLALLLLAGGSLMLMFGSARNRRSRHLGQH